MPLFITFYPAVLLAATVAGGWPGVLATVLSALVADYWFIPPFGFGAETSADLVAVAIFLGCNLSLCGLAERLRRARWAEALSLAREQDLALLDLGNVLALDPGHRILRWSEGCRRLYGFEAHEAEGRFTHDLFQTRLPQPLEDLRRILVEQGHWEGELVRHRKDGAELAIAVLWVVRRDDKGQPLALLEVSTDITERKKKEEETRRLNRTLNALGKSSQAMMRAEEEPAYLEEVCRLVVEDCGHAMVWIGYAEEDEAKTVRPLAHAGFDEGYLQTLDISWADTERGRGPTGTAIRTGEPNICRNMLTDPRFEPWRQNALARGYASSIALPLIAGGKAFGALTIYSREADPFSDDEVSLLGELANDLAHGILAIRLQVARVRAEQELRAREERYRGLVEVSPVAILVNRDNRIELVNPAALHLFGATLAEQLLGKSPFELFHPDYHAIMRKRIQELGEGRPGADGREDRPAGRRGAGR